MRLYQTIDEEENTYFVIASSKKEAKALLKTGFIKMNYDPEERKDPEYKSSIKLELNYLMDHVESVEGIVFKIPEDFQGTIESDETWEKKWKRV